MSAATKLGGFLAERLGSLVSKKVGATLAAEAIVPADMQGWPLIVFIVVQGAVDSWRYYVDRRWPARG